MSSHYLHLSALTAPIPLSLSCISGLFTANESHTFTGLSSDEPFSSAQNNSPCPIQKKKKKLTLNNNILWSSNYNMGHLRRTIVEISSPWSGSAITINSNSITLLTIMCLPWSGLSNNLYCVCLFVWKLNRMDRKFWWENGKEIFFGVCLVGWREKKINGGTWMFSLWIYQKVFSLKWGRKLKGENELLNGWKCLCALAHEQFVFFFFGHFFVLIGHHFFNKGI